MTIPVQLRRAVEERAGRRCEYCGLAQAGQEAVFHIDHVRPRLAGGETELENLALACVSCSLRKGARREASDPDTGVAAALFNPRLLRWAEHFMWQGTHVVGKTAIGRATVRTLHMNRPVILAIRSEEAHRGRHPPPP
jgi:hypothetical protein